MKTEEISKLHQVHIEALGYLERVLTTLGAVADAQEHGSGAEANKTPGFLHRLLDRAKKLKNHVVANAKVLAQAVAKHNEKTTDYLRRSSIAKALQAGSSEHDKAEEQHDKQQTLIEQQQREREAQTKASNQSNLYLTDIR